ncbi:pollen-specific leucine-rich repeat extensin-like protein 4 [Iris pallida]|uniref:Pollen-specific leucine-rich repeat extensin-like protein 4 n=1 Tax=Iris pallida TaxID=29817 RepID=A0AAX6ERP7_IRIPA|nr:pollen-specific leucine-rich repeat extensin-like protein 4 [Iris pallida]KAJ6813923.1 pollen-specific leucine-rich repeat extensin-like protein 4 [Iris pallida]
MGGESSSLGDGPVEGSRWRCTEIGGAWRRLIPAESTMAHRSSAPSFGHDRRDPVAEARLDGRAKRRWPQARWSSGAAEVRLGKAAAPRNHGGGAQIYERDGMSGQRYRRGSPGSVARGGASDMALLVVRVGPAAHRGAAPPTRAALQLRHRRTAEPGWPGWRYSAEGPGLQVPALGGDCRSRPRCRRAHRGRVTGSTALEEADRACAAEERWQAVREHRTEAAQDGATQGSPRLGTESQRRLWIGSVGRSPRFGRRRLTRTAWTAGFEHGEDSTDSCANHEGTRDVDNAAMVVTRCC